MSYWDEISARLAALTGVATPKDARAALGEFDVRDIEAVRVSEGGNGGAQPFKDLGTVTAVELVENGPKTLYTPSAGEFVCIYFAATVDVDNTSQILFEPYNTVANDASGAGVLFAKDATTSQDLLWICSQGDTISGLFFPADPIVAILNAGGNNPLLTPAGSWQAGHLYAVGDGIVDAGLHLQIVTTGGTSGGTEPVWPDDGFSSTADGGVTWQDDGLAPTTGEVHVVALTGVPAAP